MDRDPIIDEIRKIRDEYAKEFGYDVKEIVASVTDSAMKVPATDKR